jgi:hypothetical protein
MAVTAQEISAVTKWMPFEVVYQDNSDANGTRWQEFQGMIEVAAEVSADPLVKFSGKFTTEVTESELVAGESVVYNYVQWTDPDDDTNVVSVSCDSVYNGVGKLSKSTVRNYSGAPGLAAADWSNASPVTVSAATFRPARET